MPAFNDPSSWMHRLRLRVLAVLAATTLTAIAVVSWAALPLWPVIGVAVAAAALVVNTVASRLSHPVCWGCGADLSLQKPGEYGLACPRCGSISDMLARHDTPPPGGGDSQA